MRYRSLMMIIKSIINQREKSDPRVFINSRIDKKSTYRNTLINRKP